MRIHYLIHAAYESPGAIDDWAHANKHTSSSTHTYKGEKLPNANDFDFLIVMGGPQSATQLDKWAYLKDEIALIKQTIAANKPILGICLGAQLLAESLGASTQKSPHREIGVFPIELLPDAKHDPAFSQFPPSFDVMHWHNDMPGIPTNARLLAKSAGCPQQAFSVGDRLYGLQFHLEITPTDVKQMLPHEGELKPGLYIETKEKLLSHDLKEINKKLFKLLDYLSTMGMNTKTHI